MGLRLESYFFLRVLNVEKDTMYDLAIVMASLRRLSG